MAGKKITMELGSLKAVYQAQMSGTPDGMAKGPIFVKALLVIWAANCALQN
jgi:hypothetical protein